MLWPFNFTPEFGLTNEKGVNSVVSLYSLISVSRVPFKILYRPSMYFSLLEYFSQLNGELTSLWCSR